MPSLTKYVMSAEGEQEQFITGTMRTRRYMKNIQTEKSKNLQGSLNKKQITHSELFREQRNFLNNLLTI